MKSNYEVLVTFCGEEELTSITFKANNDLEALAIVVKNIGYDIFKKDEEIIDLEEELVTNDYLLSLIERCEDFYYRITNLNTNDIIYINNHIINQYEIDEDDKDYILEDIK